MLDRDYVLAVVRDITERKRAERALLESRTLLHAVVEGTSDAIFVKDLEGRYLMINSSGARLLGKTVNEVIGKDDLALFSPETARAIMAGDREVMARKGPSTYEETGTAAGATRTYLSTEGGLPRRAGEPRRVDRDRSRHHRLEAARGAIPPVAEDGSHRTPGGRSGSRLSPTS